MDVRENTSGRDRDVSEKFVELLIVSDGELNVTRDDSGTLVVSGGISCQLQDLSSEVLKDSCHVNGSSTSESRGEVHASHVSCDTSNGELKSSLGRSAARLSFALSSSSFSFSGHFDSKIRFEVLNTTICKSV